MLSEGHGRSWTLWHGVLKRGGHSAASAGCWMLSSLGQAWGTPPPTIPSSWRREAQGCCPRARPVTSRSLLPNRERSRGTSRPCPREVPPDGECLLTVASGGWQPHYRYPREAGNTARESRPWDSRQRGQAGRSRGRKGRPDAPCWPAAVSLCAPSARS